MNSANKCRCNQLMQQLREVDFCLVETILYLDAYPDHPQALEYYHRLQAERQQLIAQYESNCGPLTAYGNCSKTAWDWTKTPMPWEFDAD